MEPDKSNITFDMNENETVRNKSQAIARRGNGPCYEGVPLWYRTSLGPGERSPPYDFKNVT